MGKQWVWLGVFCSILVTGSAQAGFDFNYTVTPGTGALAGDNIFKLYARNDQAGEQLNSKKLLALDIHFKPVSGSLIFDFSDVDGDSLPDANVGGNQMDENNITGTFMRTGAYKDWFIAHTVPAPYSSKSGNPVTAFAGVTDLELVGVVLGPNNAPDATQGLGAFYGAAVVPAGVDVDIVGLVAAEYGGISGTPAAIPGTGGPVGAPPSQGPNFHFEFIAQAPEPATLAMVGMSGVIFLSRRRRLR
jgi:hypothetical protein